MIIQSLTSEITGVNDTLLEYFRGVSDALTTPDFAQVPNVYTLLTTLGADGLTGYAQANSDSAVDASSGAVSSVVYRVAGIKREIRMRSQNKSFIYARGLSSIVANNTSSSGDVGKTLSDLRGTGPSSDGVL